MKTGWRTERLRDLPVEIIDGDRSSKYPKRSEFLPTGVPFLNSSIIVDNRLVFEDANFISDEKFGQITKGRVRWKDIIVTTRGNGVGKAAYFCGGFSEALVNAQMLILRADAEVIDPRFLFFEVISPHFQAKIRGHASGSAQPQIPIRDFREIEVVVPPLPMQRRIAVILSAYDELIENSQRRIKILESMARALYREWFVHFRFPGHEFVKIIDGVPEGWEVNNLSKLCSRMESGGTPRRNLAEYWDGGEISWFKTGELWDGFLFESQEKLTELANARIFDPGTILMAIYGSPTVGRMGIVTQPSSCNQAALGLVADTKQISQTFLYFVLLSLRDHFNSMAQGAAQQNISKEKVAGTAALVPPIDLVKAFDSIAEPTFAQIQTLQRQIQNLRRTRDLLLPRLLSGQVNLKET